jgi:hypothetical protein
MVSMKFKCGDVITDGKISGIVSGVNHSAGHYLICDSNEDFVGLIRGEAAYDKAIQPFDKVKEESSPANESATGSLRYNKGKPQLSEIDPNFLLGIGKVMEKARLKYPRGNWTKGNNYSVPYDSCLRHLMSWQSGEAVDSESGESHLFHAAINIMMLAYYEANFPEMDDRIFKKDKK